MSGGATGTIPKVPPKAKEPQHDPDGNLSSYVIPKIPKTKKNEPTPPAAESKTSQAVPETNSEAELAKKAQLAKLAAEEAEKKRLEEEEENRKRSEEAEERKRKESEIRKKREEENKLKKGKKEAKNLPSTKKKPPMFTPSTT